MANPLDPSFLYEAAWGNIRIFLSTFEWEAGNTQVIHELASGDDHPMQPRGKRLRTATAELIFDDFPGAAERGVEAYRRFEAAAGERRIFTHPVEGSFYARIGEMKPKIDESSVICVTCQIIPDTSVDPVTPTGASTSTASGQNAVGAAASVVEKKMAAAHIGFPTAILAKMNFKLGLRANVKLGFQANLNVGLSANLSAGVSASAAATATASGTASAFAGATASASALAFADVYADAYAQAQVSALADATATGSASAFALAYASAAVTADARATVDAWRANPDLSLRQIQIDAARLSQSIADLIAQGELELHLELWPCFVACILLGEAVRAAAIAASSDTPRVFQVRVRTRTSLLPLAAKLYGGAAARDRAAQILTLNDIKTPAWLEPGEYLMPARDPSARPSVSFAG